MIAWLRGRVEWFDEAGVVLNVGGVGYDVQVTSGDAADLQVGEDLTLWVHTVVREDAFALFGFRELASRDLFRSLTSVSGVGPRGAQALLDALSPHELARAIHDGQPGVLTRAKGIGKRTAEMLIVKLRDRLPPPLLFDAPVKVSSAPATDLARDAVSALTNLGFRASSAEQAVDQVLDEQPNLDLNGLITASLGALRLDAR